MTHPREETVTIDTAFEHVLITIEDRIGTITLNRPDKLNAFAGRMREEITQAVTRLATDADVRVIVITGAGRAFCAGADIGYMRELLERRHTDAFAALVDAGRNVVSAIQSAPKPVIASVNGAAAGGGANLALACDLRIASDRASIGQTFNRIGLHPDWGGTYFLPRLVGLAKAMELVFTGDMIDAAEAHRIGLFNRVVPDGDLPAATRRLAEQLAAKPPRALALAKAALSRSAHETLDRMLDIELDNQLHVFDTDDAREGLSAFLEKRPPAFQGR